MRSRRLNSISLSKYLNARVLKYIVGTLIYTLAEPADKKAIVIKATPLIGLIAAIKRNITRLFRSVVIKKYFAKNVLNAIGGSNYYVFPIHYQPEASTAIGSPYHSDQINLLKNLAFSMPDGVKLVVKEHVSNIGYPNSDFYKIIKSLPNVVLVWHRFNIKDLIRKSLGVITLTSTAGFEALLLDRPVYHFGDVFYTFHPKAKRLDGWDEVKQSLSVSLCSKKYDNISFLVAYRRYNHDGCLNFDSEDFGIADILLNKVQSHMIGML